MVTGSMPGVLSGKYSNLPVFYENYIRTYIERDVRRLLGNVDALQYAYFMRAVAARCAQMLNVAAIAEDVGIRQEKAKTWLSALERSGIIFYLHPYSNNQLKRTVKAPKLYCHDCGLMAHLTRWTSPETMEAGAMAGTFMENFVVSEIYKSYLNTGVEPPLYYYRDRNAKEIDIVIELLGGIEPATSFMLKAMENNKHVVTANKAAIAANYHKLMDTARDNGVAFRFEASVGGGIPLLRPLTQSLAGEKIEEISGILNGTTNYILTKMAREGQTFEEALKKAQELGYAERNPEADVEGYDTCRKITILTSLATGKEVNYEDVPTEGITKITDTDFKYAAKLGTSIKLFGTSRMEGNKASVYVCPMMIGPDHPLFAVNDVYNAVMVRGNTLGTVMFYGSGAGKLPTASAVVSDIVEIAGHMEDNIPTGWTDEKQPVAPMGEVTFSYFLRLAGKSADKLADVRAAFGEAETIELPEMDEFAVVTGEMTEARFRKLAAAFEEDIRQTIRYTK